MKPVFFKRAAGIGAVSFMNMALTALQSIVLGHVLSVSDFGITRTATAYMVTLSMLGHFTLHNAVASHIARARLDDEQVGTYIASALCLVGAISAGVAVTAILFVEKSGLWNHSLVAPLAFVIATLPLVCITITLNACLEALGNLKLYALVIALTAIVPFVLIVPFGYFWQLQGWIAGRTASALALTAISVVAVRQFWQRARPSRTACGHLLVFARIQIISGVLSLVMMSADVIALERMTNDLPLVANYGAALLFTSACAVFPTVLGRIYLREIATSATRRNEFLVVTLLAGLVIGAILYSIAPSAIALIFGSGYSAAHQIVRIQSFGLFASFLWTALSFVNIGEGRPHDAAAISLAGAIVGTVALFMLIPAHGAIGAAWAMVLANSAGCATGLVRLYTSRTATEAHAL